MVFPVVGQALVECAVLLGCDITGIESPDGFHLVDLGPPTNGASKIISKGKESNMHIP
jgi:hypothetical protein